MTDKEKNEQIEKLEIGLKLFEGKMDADSMAKFLLLPLLLKAVVMMIFLIEFLMLLTRPYAFRKKVEAE
jgi:hypothetical protein